MALEFILSYINGDLNAGCIDVRASDIGKSGLIEVANAIRINQDEVLRLKFFKGFFSDQHPDAGFYTIAAALVGGNTDNPPQKSQRLNLTFYGAKIDPTDVIFLINNPNCPVGLSLIFENCIDAASNVPFNESKETQERFTRALNNNNKIIEFIIDKSIIYHSELDNLTKSPKM